MLHTLRKIINSAIDIFLATRQENIEPDFEYLNSSKDGLFSLERCYGCDGTGLTENSDGVDQIMPSWSGYFDGESLIYSRCPICKGAGYISKSTNH